jgi:PAS domain S-box-containing protein
VSFYDANTVLVWAVVTGFIGFSVTIALLLLYIRQRRLGEEALKGSEEKYRSLVNNINVGVCRTSPSARYLQVNPAMAKIFGYDTTESLMETSVTDIYRDPDDRKRLYEKLHELGTVRDVEMAMRKKDGTPIWVSLSVNVQRDQQGTIIWADTVLEDVTERKKAREDLQEAHEQLEARVARRTSELSIANEHLKAKNIETSVLYEVSSAISQSMGMDELLPRVLSTISSIEELKTDKGGIFVVEGDKMRMIANVGHSDHFVELHDDMHVGDCLCGIVAQTGEVIISANSSKDGRHSIVDCDAAIHGHIIVPLKSKDRVEGVLDLYTVADAVLGDDEVSLLLGIGNQLGVAIENAKLYEETKALSLRDSLTGLWNHGEIIRILGQERDLIVS